MHYTQYNIILHYWGKLTSLYTTTVGKNKYYHEDFIFTNCSPNNWIQPYGISNRKLIYPWEMRPFTECDYVQLGTENNPMYMFYIEAPNSHYKLVKKRFALLLHHLGLIYHKWCMYTIMHSIKFNYALIKHQKDCPAFKYLSQNRA